MPRSASRVCAALLGAALAFPAAAGPVRHAFLATGAETFITDESGKATWT